MLTFGELAWAAYIYAIVTKGDKAYWRVEEWREFIDGFVRVPGASDLEKIEEVVVMQFLNHWGRCRIPEKKIPGIARGVKDKLGELGTAQRNSLRALSIRDVAPARLSEDTASRIKNLYDALGSIDGCGPTVVSKILFILFPELCMMWDWYIRDHLRECQPPIRRDDGQGYVCFLRHHGGDMAKSVSNDYRETLGRRDRPEDYLSRTLYAEPRTKTLAKYLDEYLWIKITNIDQIDEQHTPFDVFPPPEWLTSLAHS